MKHARETLGLGRIVAITTKDNEPSIRLSASSDSASTA